MNRSKKEIKKKLRGTLRKRYGLLALCVALLYLIPACALQDIHKQFSAVLYISSIEVVIITLWMIPASKKLILYPLEKTEKELAKNNIIKKFSGPRDGTEMLQLLLDTDEAITKKYKEVYKELKIKHL